MMFISWICPILRCKRTFKGKNVYNQGDDIKCIYFNTKGTLAFILPKYQNTEFVRITKGNTFGAIDIMGSMLEIFEQK